MIEDGPYLRRIRSERGNIRSHSRQANLRLACAVRQPVHASAAWRATFCSSPHRWLDILPAALDNPAGALQFGASFCHRGISERNDQPASVRVSS